MFQKQLTGRGFLIGVFGALVVLSAAPARAERLGDERACVTAFKKAREHEQAGKLQESKDALMSCAQAPCSGFIRQQCSSKYNQLESDTPSVVLIVTDASGSPRADVQVRMDGEPFAQQLDGRALSIDPGMHEFSFSADGAVFATQKIMIVQGQRNRFITALIRTGGKQKRMVAEAAGDKPAKKGVKADDEDSEAAAPAAKSAAVASSDAKSDEEETKTEAIPAKKSGSVVPYLLGAVGVAGLAAGGVLTYWGRKDNGLLQGCSPMCDPAATNHIKKLYLGSDIALGVGVAALGAAYWAYIATHHGDEEKGEEKGEEKAKQEALRFDVVPTTTGGYAGVSGSF